MVGGLGLGWVGGVLRRRGGWMGCQYERRMGGEGQAGREGDALGFAGRTVRRRVQKSVSDAFERSTVKKDRERGGGPYLLLLLLLLAVALLLVAALLVLLLLLVRLEAPEGDLEAP